MSAFRDTAQVEDVIGSLFRALLEDPETREKYTATGLRVQFVMTGPEGLIAVTPEGVVTGRRLPADVTMTMEADTAHDFWLGETTLPRALSTGTIKAEGQITKVLGLLPLLKTAFRLYPKLARSKGVEV